MNYFGEIYGHLDINASCSTNSYQPKYLYKICHARRALYFTDKRFVRIQDALLLNVIVLLLTIG